MITVKVDLMYKGGVVVKAGTYTEADFGKKFTEYCVDKRLVTKTTEEAKPKAEKKA